MTDPSLLSRKTKSTLGAQLNEAAADISCAFGRRMLAKFGWSEGKGLGKNEDGMLSHIRVEQRADNLGLGATDGASAALSAFAPPPQLVLPRAKAKKRKEAKAATQGSGVEETPLKARNGNAKAAPGKKRKVEGAERSPSCSGVVPGLSDDQLFALCGGARLGMRARATQSGKEKRMQAADAEFLAKYGAAEAVDAQPVAAAEASQNVNAKSFAEKRSHVEFDESRSSRAELKEARKAARKALKKAERRQLKLAQRRAAPP